MTNKKKNLFEGPEFSKFLENFLLDSDFDSVTPKRPLVVENSHPDLDVFDKRHKKKPLKKNYGEDIRGIKEAFRRSKLSEFVQRRLRSMDIHEAIYGDFGLEVPELPTKISEDFFKIGWSEEFYYHIISYDLVHEGVLDCSRQGIHEFLFPYNKRIVMEMAIPIEQDAEFNMHKAYCFLRSFSEPTFESRITFSNIDAVYNKLRHSHSKEVEDVKFCYVSVSFRHYQFFQMLGCLFRILDEVKGKGVAHSIVYLPDTHCVEICINNIGELDLDDLKFDYFLWKHPLRFIIKNIDYHVLKYFNFFWTYDNSEDDDKSRSE
jgi:hypothetical protein